MPTVPKPSRKIMLTIGSDYKLNCVYIRQRISFGRQSAEARIAILKDAIIELERVAHMTELHAVIPAHRQASTDPATAGLASGSGAPS